MSDLLTVGDAAAKYHIPERTLTVLIERNNLTDPIGGEGQVYDDWRLERLAKKVAAGRAATNSPAVRP